MIAVCLQSMPQMGVDVPNKVMVALCQRRISLFLDHQAHKLVQPGQAATAIMMSYALRSCQCRVSSRVPSSSWHQSPYAMTLVGWTHVEARGLCYCVKMDRAPLAGTRET